MSEKRFKKMDTIIDPFPIWDTVEEKGYNCTDTLDLLVDLLNEQQELIEELHISNEMGWKRAERFEKKCPKELHNKKMYIKRLEYKVQKFKRDIEELGISIKLFEDDIATKDKKIEEQQEKITELEIELTDCKNRKEQLEYKNTRFTIQKASGMYLHLPIFDNDVEMADGDVCILLNEQQATIRKLQDLCGESDGENAKLRIENKELQEELKLLKPTNVEQYEQIVQLQEENEQLKKSEKINMEYAEQIVEENHKLRIAKNDLRIENEQLKNRLNKEYIKECSIK